MKFAVMVIDATRHDDLEARQALSKPRDMLHQRFTTRHVGGRILVHPIVAPCDGEQATALRLVNVHPGRAIGAHDDLDIGHRASIFSSPDFESRLLEMIASGGVANKAGRWAK